MMSFQKLMSYQCITKTKYDMIMKISSKINSGLLVLTALSVLSGCGVSDSKTEPDQLKAKIDESSVNFTTDLTSIDGRRIKAGQSITLKDASLGAPDSWEWSFSDNSEMLSGQSISKKWDDALGQVQVILKVTRAEDSATDSDTLVIQVGPVEILNRAVYGFEDQEAEFTASSKWFYWTPNDGTVSIAMENASGANGTNKSLKLNASSSFGEFQLRPHENGPEFLVSLKSNTTYIYSFYMKGSQAFTLSEANFLNVKNDAPKEGWYTPFWSGEATYGPINVTTSWSKFSYEFTTADLTTFADEGYADGKADNAGPFFKHFNSITGASIDVWVDEISLKEKDL